MRGFGFGGVAFILFLLSACPTPVPEAPRVIDNSECAKACDNLELLGCKTSSGRPLTHLDPKKSCTEACKDKLAQGIDLHTACVARAGDCEEVKACALE